MNGGDSAGNRLLVELERSQEKLNDLIKCAAAEWHCLESQLEEMHAEIARFTDRIADMKRKAKETWKTNCELLILYDE